MLNFELRLEKLLMELSNEISSILINQASEDLAVSLKKQAYAKGGRKAIFRPLRFRLRTGHIVQTMGLYVKKLVDQAEWLGSRHLLENHWTIIGGSSPAHYDRVVFCAMLSPSYDIAQQALTKFGVEQTISGVRTLTNSLGTHCEDREVELSTQPSDDLKDKQVVIGIDGGRTRTRCYTGQANKAGQATYETPWREPRLFTIGVLDKQGKLEKEYPPIYGCRFDEEAIIDLLGQYLKHLNIHQAKLIQIVADGAQWIWNRVKGLLIDLGVDTCRIVETLDYCHAVSYIYKLVGHLPNRVGKPARRSYVKQFKQWLWQGKSVDIVAKCKELYKRPSSDVNCWITYLEKHIPRTQYTDYEINGLMCGSGIIESGIRRVINLRFKNAGTFWKEHVVEDLYFLRAILLAKRWDLMINNLAKGA
ncbi:MAG: hypothetical protein DHS20C07_31720 [Methyloligella sp.]|nr:MAG: hypothetical protein DHS20C07_31720 [Methyloligella sp.]